MKHKLILIGIISLFSYSSLIKAMEKMVDIEKNIKSEENSISKLVKNYNQHYYMRTTIDLNQANLTTGTLHDKNITKVLPCFFISPKKNTEENYTILLGEPLFYAAAVYQPNDDYKNNDLTIEQLITKSKNNEFYRSKCRILLQHKMIKAHLNNNLVILKTAKIINPQNDAIYFDLNNTLEDLMIDSLDNYSNKDNANDKILLYRAYFLLFFLQSFNIMNNDLYQKKIKLILNKDKKNKCISKISHTGSLLQCLQELFESTLFIEEAASNVKKIEIRIDTDLFQSFILNSRIIEILNQNNNEADKKYTKLENIIIKYCINKKKIEEKESQQEQIIPNNNLQIGKSEQNKISESLAILFSIMSEIKFQFHNTRTLNGGDPTRWGTYAGIENQLNIETDIAILDVQLKTTLIPMLRKYKIQDKPIVPFYKFLTQKEKASEVIKHDQSRLDLDQLD